MKFYFYLLATLFTASNLYSLNYSFVEDTIRAGEVIVGESKTLQVTITNNTESKLNLIDLKEFDDYDYYSVEFSPVSINPNSSLDVLVKVEPKHNINSYLNLFIKFNLDDNSIQYFPITIFTKGVLANPYYNSTQNLWGSQLFTALQNLIKAHTSFTYKQARTIIWTGADRTDGSIECIYTGRKKAVADVPDFEQYDSDGFNTEHVWPRAYGADDEPELSDMFHIYPTFKTANTKRDNYPFDYVTSNIAYEDNGSKLGKNSKGQIAFEVRDISKGNIARSIFYFATRYGNLENNLDNQESTLREWNIKDVPDQNESNRNDSIFVYQKNRNPYIDFPGFLERMPSLSEGGGDLPKNSEVFQIDTLYQFVGLVKENELKLETYIFNKGNLPASINSLELIPYDKSFKFDTQKISSSIQPNSYHTAYIIYDAKANDGKSVNDTVTIKLELSNGKVLSQKYVVMANINSIEDQLDKETLLINNPSNLRQKIVVAQSFDISNSTLNITNLQGEIIYSEKLNDRIINFDNLKINIENGTYIVNIKNNKYSINKKIIVIK